jgi:hypothetical protein
MVLHARASRERGAPRLAPSSCLSNAWIVGLCAAGVLGCGGGGSASGSSAPPGTDTGSDAAGAQPRATFTEVYTTILRPTCAACHNPSGEGPFQDFSSQSSAFAGLVGVRASGPSCGSSNEQRVVPGNASQSLLLQKLSDPSPPCGAQMPLGGPPLSGGQVMLVEAWINAGALDD